MAIKATFHVGHSVPAGAGDILFVTISPGQVTIRVPQAPRASSPAVRRVMQGNRSEGTRPEAAVRSAAHRLGLRFRKHRAPLQGLRCKADLVFPTERIAVFVDGCFWHGCPIHGKSPRTNSSYWSAKIAANVARDERNNNALADAGWMALRAWEHERPEIVAWRVSVAVKSKRARLSRGGDDG